MKQLLIVLPIISLLALTGILILKEKPYTQDQPATFQSYGDCYNSKYNFVSNCYDDKDYQKAVEQYYIKTYQPTTITPECKQFMKYRSTSQYNYQLNLNDLYSKCYQDPQIIAIVNSSSCFKTYYYDPIVIGCGGL